MTIYKNKKVMLYFITLLVLVFSVSFLFLHKAKADDNSDRCLFCNTSDSTAKKEKQFAQKVQIIKGIFGNQIDAAVLAATVLYIDFDASVSKYYDEDFDSTEYKENWENIKDGIGEAESSEESDQSNISNEQIDLLTAAAILMVTSSGFGNAYDEDAYKEALMLDAGFVDDALVNGIFCSGTSQALAGGFSLFVGGLRQLNPFDDYTASDALTFVTDMHNICEVGFLEATYNSVKSISDDDKKKKKKQAIADEIIYYAKLYKPWFGIEDEDACLVTGSTGDFTSWKQCDSSWGGNSLGSKTICSIGCLATSISIQIARSGTSITNIPSGYTAFNPGAFVSSISSNGGLSGNSIAWNWSNIAPNFNPGRFVNYTNKSGLASELTKVLSEKEEGKYQRYVVINITHPSQHWVAVEGVQDGKVIINDPAKDGTTLDENYPSWSLVGYRIMWATDGTDEGANLSNVSACNTNGSLDDLLKVLGLLEGISGSCTVDGQEGYESYIDSMDQHYAGKTTAYGITQVYNKDLAQSIGYTNFDRDMSNGCVNKNYINQMASKTMEQAIEKVSSYYEKKSGGKSLTTTQYHALALIYHHWPVGVYKIIDQLVNMDKQSYSVYELFLKYNGLHGAQGGLNRREAEYHLFYNGNYNLEKVGDARISEDYWKKRIEVYKNELSS